MFQLRGLKSGKAVGLDNISPWLLKDCADIITKSMATIINASLQQGKVPVDWKAARVIPLFKKGKAETMDNYRPTILTTVSKLLESVIHSQLCCYREDLCLQTLLLLFKCSKR